MLRTQFLVILTAFLAAPLVIMHPTVVSARQNRKIEVALTVDDLPGMGALPAGGSRTRIAQDLIRALKEKEVPAYGFVNGVQFDADPPQVEVLKAWASAGFLIGNHTFSHLSLSNVSAETYIADIERMDRRLAALKLTGEALRVRRVFRYPYLSEGDTLAKRDAVRRYLFANQYRIAEVTVDYKDWAWNDAYTRCVARNDSATLGVIRTRARASAQRHLEESVKLARILFGRDIRHILLIHMGAFEAAELGGIISEYRAAGVKFIALRQAMEDPAYEVNPNYPYKGKDKTFLQQILESRKIDYPLDNKIDSPEKIAVICQ
jgi:peptidoglycan-N-acetylglucosamine deacetylase